MAMLFFMVYVTWSELSSSVNAQKDLKDIPTPKFAKMAVPTLKFLFW